MVLLSLILVTLAVARLTRLVTVDQITLTFRRWVVNRWGDESSITYLVHCSWCTSIWLSIIPAAIWTALMLPVRQWWVAVPTALAISYVSGILSQIEER